MKRQFLLVLLTGSLIGRPAMAQQRGGGRGTTPTQGAYTDTLNAYRDAVSAMLGAWWLNTSLVRQLGISEDQRAQIEKVFENHRLNLESNKAALEKEETQLAQLLNAESFDRNATLAQTNRVIQARSDLERENAIMTLEMRAHLTRTQWMELPKPSVGVTWSTRTPAPRSRWQDGGGARGTRGQQ